MDEKLEAIIADGGAWKFGDPGAPSHFRPESKGPEFKSLLPNVPKRMDVPAPSQVPWGGVGLLNLFMNNNLVLVGTGFLCQPDVLVTAKHNLTAKTYDAAGVWMGFDAKLNPHVSAIGIKAYAVHKDLDIAIFILGTQQVGAFELGGVLPPPYAGVTLAGYAIPYSNGAVRYSYAIGPVTSADSTRIAYAINTREGDSGAPVFVVNNGIPTVIGIHTEAQSNLNIGNSGVYLSPLVVQDIFKLIAWARAQIGEH